MSATDKQPSQPCPQCGGTGHEPSLPSDECNCGMRGHKVCSACDGNAVEKKGEQMSATERNQPQKTGCCLWCEAVARSERVIPPVTNYKSVCDGHKRLLIVIDCLIRSNVDVPVEAADEAKEMFFARAAEIYKEKLAAEEKLKCSACSGSGHVCSDPYHGCPVCEGTGLAASSEGAKQGLKTAVDCGSVSEV